MFNLLKELEKVKTLMPLSKHLKQPTYKDQVSQFMFLSASVQPFENLNQEERKIVVFGHHAKDKDPSNPPFYVTL